MNRLGSFQLFVIILSITLARSGHAQKDFRPGYVVRTNGDTVEGQIQYRAAGTSSTCSFRLTGEGIVSHYTPSDLSAFRFTEGKLFISREITTETGPRLVFLEFLVKGKACMYYMRNGTDHYYIEKEGGILVELTEKEKIYTDNLGSDVVRPDQYTGKLKAVLSDCPSLFKQIDRTSLSHNSLVQLARDYHARVCSTEDCIVFERNRKPVRLRIGLYGGYTLNRIKFGGKLSTEETSGGTIKYGSQLVSGYRSGFLAGCRFEVENLLSTFEHASLVIDVSLQGFFSYRLTETGQYDLVTYGGTKYFLSRNPNVVYQESMEANIKTYLLKIPLMFNYRFLNGTFRPYLNAGVMNMFVISQNKDFLLDRFVKEFDKSVPGYHIGFAGNGGVRVMSGSSAFFFAEMGYEFTQTTNVWPDLRFINSLFSMKVGFMF